MGHLEQFGMDFQYAILFNTLHDPNPNHKILSSKLRSNYRLIFLCFMLYVGWVVEKRSIFRAFAT